MQQLNRITLIGRVGRCSLTAVGDTRLATLSVCTNYAYRAKDGTCVIETQWHNVRAFENNCPGVFDRLTKGTPVHVQGRLRNQRYTDANGDERSFTEVVASKLKVIDLTDDDTLQPEHIS